MKTNIIKSLLVASLLIAANFNASAASSSSTNAAGLNSLLTSGANLKQITVANLTTNVATCFFIDSPSTNLTYTLAAYTVRSQTTGNVTNIYTNVLGALTTNIYSANIITLVTNAASTNNYAYLTTLVVPASATLTYTPTSFVSAGRGVLLTNNQSVAVTLEYDSTTAP